MTEQDLQALYVAKFYLSADRRPFGSQMDHELHSIHFRSMAQLCEWVEFNNYVVGTPLPNTAIFSIEHADGSPISDEEMTRLARVANEDAYRQRQQYDKNVRPSGIYDGYAHALISRHGPVAQLDRATEFWSRRGYQHQENADDRIARDCGSHQGIDG